MKRSALLFLCLLLLAALCLPLTSCTDGGEHDGGRLRVVTTIFPQYDFVRAIAGGRVSLSMMISPGSESHTYEPSAADAAEVAGADLFIYTGGDADGWAKPLADAVSGSGTVMLPMWDAAAPGGGTPVGERHGHEQDEHMWTTPDNAVLILYRICEALIGLDPEGEEIYRRNADAYAERLRSIGEAFSSLAERAEGKTVVIADRFPFEGCFEHYGINYVSALDGCAVGVEPPVRVIGEMLDLLEGGEIKYVFYIEFSDRKTAHLLSQATGCSELLLHSCHNVSREDFDAGVTFCDIMEENVKNLSEALS